MKGLDFRGWCQALYSTARIFLTKGNDMDLTMHGVTECTLKQEHFDGGGEPDALRYPKEKSESYKSRYPE
jgi:hypothetical protein